MPPFGNALARVEEARTAFESRMRQRVMMVGWLEQSGGLWTCHTSWDVDREHDLVVAFSEKPGGKAQWRKVGKATAEGVRLVVSDGAFLRNGRPVFAVTRPQQVVSTTSR